MELAEAIALACEWHKDQVDKSGKPYIGHLIRVMAKCPPGCQDVAILHDIVEDTDMTLEQLFELGLSRDKVEAVDLLTRKSSDTHQEYIMKIKTAPGIAGIFARAVKIADLQDNMSPDRAISGKEGESLMKRYTKAIDILNSDKL